MVYANHSQQGGAMKIKIELILGLLESGKTNFINSMLESDEFYNETIVVIQDEFGQTNINYPNDKISKKKYKLNNNRT